MHTKQEQLNVSLCDAPGRVDNASDVVIKDPAHTGIVVVLFIQAQINRQKKTNKQTDVLVLDRNLSAKG